MNRAPTQKKQQGTAGALGLVQGPTAQSVQPAVHNTSGEGFPCHFSPAQGQQRPAWRHTGPWRRALTADFDAIGPSAHSTLRFQL